MGDQNINPFADPNEINPTFGGASAAAPPPTNDFNPFADQQQSQFQPQQPPASQQQQQNFYPANYPTTPATIEPTRAEVPFQNTYGGGYGQDDSMRARQQELERKAADLEKREAELKAVQAQGGMRENNFPPLPSFCCVGPCYYHDISVEIPMESQKTCKMMFVIWQFYVFCLFFNCITALASLCIGYSKSATLFGVSILYLVLFPPLSFVFWYRPIYKALRSGSSFNFMLFFFIFFFQTVFTVLYGLGLDFLGTCGWINGASIAATKTLSGNEGVAAMFFISGALFSLLAVFKILLLRKVHTSYRRSGATMDKAKSEFAQGIATNKNVQNAAVEAVRAGVGSNQQQY